MMTTLTMTIDDDDGLCHEYIAILSQFCAQVITYTFILPLAIHKMLLYRVTKKTSNNFIREH